MTTAPHILPARVHFVEAGTAVLHLDGIVTLPRLARLHSAVLEEANPMPVAVALHCARAEDGGDLLEGTLQGRLALRCVRCLEPMHWTFDLPVRLRLARSDAEERRLLDQCEPLLLEDDWLPLHALIEDEILLALPMAPRHAQGSCPSSQQNR